MQLNATQQQRWCGQPKRQDVISHHHGIAKANQHYRASTWAPSTQNIVTRLATATVDNTETVTPQSIAIPEGHPVLDPATLQTPPVIPDSDIQIGSLISGIVKSADVVTVELEDGRIGTIPNAKLSYPKPRNAASVVETGERITAVVEKLEPLTLNTAALQIMPGEWSKDKAGILRRVEQFLSNSGPHDIKAYSSWVVTHLLSNVVAPRIPSIEEGKKHVAQGWHTLRAGSRAMGIVMSVRQDMAYLRLDKLGVMANLHVSQVSNVRCESEEMAKVFTPGRKIMVMVRKIEPGVVPGAYPKVYLTCKPLESRPGLILENVEAYNAEAPAQHRKQILRQAEALLSEAQERLEQAQQVEADRKSRTLSLPLNSLVKGTVKQVKSFGVVVKMEGGQMLLLHRRNMSKPVPKEEDVARLMPYGTEVIAMLTMVKVNNGMNRVERPGLSTAVLEQTKGDFVNNHEAFKQAAAAAYEKQQAAAEDGQSSSRSKVVDVAAQPPNFMMLQDALLSLNDVPLPSLISNISSAPGVVDEYLQAVAGVQALLESSFDKLAMPWAPTTKATKRENSWYSVIKEQRGLFALMTSLRFKAKALRMIAGKEEPAAQADAAPASSSSNNGASTLNATLQAAADADAGGLAAAMPLLVSNAGVPSIHPTDLKFALKGFADACAALRSHGSKEHVAVMETSWFPVMIQAAHKVATSDKLSAQWLLDSTLLPCLHISGLADLEHSLMQESMQTAFNRLSDRLVPGPTDFHDFLYAEMSAATQQQKSKQKTTKDSGKDSNSAEAAAQESSSRPHRDSTQQRLLALNSSLSLLQIAASTGYQPTTQWWSRLLRTLAAYTPELFQDQSLLSAEESAVVAKIRSVATHLSCARKPEAAA